MFDPGSDYAPDLEWMLQSGQVPHDLLLEALIHEFYAPVYRFALCILDDQISAHKAARDVFSRAVVEIHKYRPQEGAEIWLLRIAMEAINRTRAHLQTRRTIQAYFPFHTKSGGFGDSLPHDRQEAETWLAFDSTPLQSRIAAILHFVLEWPLDKVARLTARSIDELITDLLNVVHKCLPDRVVNPGNMGSPDFIRSEEALNSIEVTGLAQSLRDRWPPIETNQEDLERMVGRSTLNARLIGSRQKSLVSFFEILVIGLIILIGVGIAWGINRFGESEQPKTTLSKAANLVVVTEVVLQYITATPEAPTVLRNATPEPTQLPQNQVVVAEPLEGLEALADRIGIPVESLQKFNRIPPGTRLNSGQRLLIPGQFDEADIPFLTPVPTQVPAPILKEPYFSESVLQRIAVQGPVYTTLWFDAIITDLGPQSYSGPARVYRWQSWLAKDQSLNLIGIPGEFPQEVLLSSQNGTFFARPAQDMLWFSEWRGSEGYQSDVNKLISRASKLIFDTHDLERGATFKVNGREPIAGISALAVDVYNQDQQRSGNFWYDDRRGLILRRVSFYPVGSDIPAFEVELNRVEYNVDFPPQLFSERIPWRGGFAGNSNGATYSYGETSDAVVPMRPPLLTPQEPHEFNPGASVLSFQYPSAFDTYTPAARVQIFADGIPIGAALFGNPWELICDRSPDGSWIAFVSQPVPQAGADSRLKWFHLPAIDEQVGELPERSGVTDFAFSPDGRQIAYFANPDRGGMGVLGVVEIASQKDQPLLKLSDVNSLVWNPDSSSLAMIARDIPGSYLEHILVYDIATNQITYNASIDIQSNAIQEWPMLEWGVEFPVEMGVLDDCALAPLPDG